MKKNIAISLAFGTAMAMTGATVYAGEQSETINTEESYLTLSGVEAIELTQEEMAEVEGKAHDTFPLGALLLDKTDGKIANTPAWLADHGLHPLRALSKAQVPE